MSNNTVYESSSGPGAQTRGNGGPARRRLEDGRELTRTPGVTIGRVYLAELEFQEGELVAAQVESAEGGRLVAAAERFFSAVAELWTRAEFESVPIAQISVPVAPGLAMRMVHSGSVAGTPTIVFSFKGTGELPSSRTTQVKLADGTTLSIGHSFRIDGPVAKAVWRTLKAASGRQDQRRASQAQPQPDDVYERAMAA